MHWGYLIPLTLGCAVAFVGGFWYRRATVRCWHAGQADRNFWFAVVVFFGAQLVNLLLCIVPFVLGMVVEGLEQEYGPNGSIPAGIVPTAWCYFMLLAMVPAFVCSVMSIRTSRQPSLYNDMDDAKLYLATLAAYIQVLAIGMLILGILSTVFGGFSVG